LASSKFLFSIIEASRDHVRMNVLSAACANNLVNTVFNTEQLTGIENHADVRVREVILFISTTSPGDLREFAGLHITKQESAAG
jgi:hypothetical protein